MGICFDEDTAEGLVQYMYKWKVSGNNVIVDNEGYIKELLKLLTEESKTYQYINTEFEFAQLLSEEETPVKYPISDGVLTARDISLIINERSDIRFLLKINLEHLHRCIIKMQEIIADQLTENEG